MSTIQKGIGPTRELIGMILLGCTLKTFSNCAKYGFCHGYFGQKWWMKSHQHRASDVCGHHEPISCSETPTSFKSEREKRGIKIPGDVHAIYSVGSI